MEKPPDVTNNGDDNAPAETPSVEPAVDVSARLPRKGNAAFLLLVEAYDYARDLGQDRWNFAVEIHFLHKAGLSNSDFRWLVSKGVMEHALEITTNEDAQRRFLETRNLTFRKESCFVLSEAGLLFARRSFDAGSNSRLPRSSDAKRQGDVHEDSTSPKWDSSRRALRLNGCLVKQFKGPAANQETVLAAFEEENWPPRIDDPLPPHPELDAKRRLHTTINSLNNRQENFLIRFRGDGSGQGVRWEVVATPPDSDSGSDRSSGSQEGEPSLAG